MKPAETGWCVVVRAGMEPDGRWMVMGFTYSRTRKSALGKYAALWAKGRARYDKLRRKGIACCVRASLQTIRDLP